MKKILIPVGLFLVIVISSLSFYFINAKYTMLDIDADNYDNILLLKKPLTYITPNDVNFDNFIPDAFHLLWVENEYDFNNPKTLPNLIFKKSNYENNKSSTSIESSLTGLTYGLNQENKHSPYAVQIYSNSEFSEKYLDQIISDLMTKEQFIKKESLIKGGSDILIKENEDKIIVVLILKGFAYGHKSISFHAYKKNKYF